MKRGAIIVILFLFFSALFTISVLGSPHAIEKKTDDSGKGPFFDTICDGNICEMTIYSYEKYFLRNGQWENIDENFYDCSQNGTTRFCTKDYYFNAVADDSGLVSSSANNKDFSLRMIHFSDRQGKFNPSIDGSVLTYQNIIPNVDLRYQYLPTKLKEEIVIKEPLEALPDHDFNVTFAKFGDANFIVDESSICDSNFTCEDIPTVVSKDEIKVQVPIDFLTNNRTIYPVTIDPTIYLNGTNITWNGYVTNTSNATGSSYVRTSNPIDYLSSGYIPDITPGETKHARAEMDFNTVAIPNSADLRKLQVQIYLETSSVNGTNVTLTLNHMEKNSSQYADVTTLCQGNCQFYKDMGNGSAYSSATYVSKQNVLLNFSSQGMTDFRNSFSSNWFGLGLAGNYLPTAEVKIGSRDNSNSSRRPKLIVTYSVEEYNVTWDANGNMKQGLGKYLEYDSWHRVSKIRQNNATGNILEEYLYDQDGNRLKKIEYRGGNISNNETTYYFNSRPVDFIQVRNASGIFNFSYYYMNGKLVASKMQGKQMLYYHDDHLGSTTLVTNQSGDVVENDVYLPYGGIYSGIASSKYLFTGKERDDGTGFDYFGARYYSSQFMHWLQVDSFIKNIYEPQNLNRFSYVLNNPYRYVDPTGHFFVFFEIPSPAPFPLFANDNTPVPVPIEADTAGTEITNIDTGASEIMSKANNVPEEIVSKIDGNQGESGFSRGLNEQWKSMEKRFNNIKNEELSKKTIEGAGREIEGGETLDRTGKPANHIQKYQQGQQGLKNQLETFKKQMGDNRINEEFKKIIQNKISERSKFLNWAQKELKVWRNYYKK